MSNHDPRPGASRPGPDPAADAPRDPTGPPDDGRPGYVMLAALAAAALMGGFLYFGMPRNDVPAQALVPIPAERTLTDNPGAPTALPPADRPASIAIPANPATNPVAPGPAAPQE
jgi:hypothetical protein